MHQIAIEVERLSCVCEKTQCIHVCTSERHGSQTHTLIHAYSEVQMSTCEISERHVSVDMKDMCTSEYACMCAHSLWGTNEYLYGFICTCVHVCMSRSICACVYKCIYVYMCTCTCAYESAAVKTRSTLMCCAEDRGEALDSSVLKGGGCSGLV